jgi:hypothetical protein
MRDWLQVGINATALAIVVFMVGWYVYFVWSDCLNENSFLTCARMLR